MANLMTRRKKIEEGKKKKKGKRTKCKTSEWKKLVEGRDSRLKMNFLLPRPFSESETIRSVSVQMKRTLGSK
jgi:hypothetical protein